MHRATAKISFLTGQVNEADDEELRQLRNYHDRTRLLEGEHRDLQHRFNDQGAKLAKLGRTVATVRQTLAQAHQRAVEWEKRAKETVTEISNIRNQLEEASHAETQLDSEFSLLKLQLREKEADERLTRDRESKLRDQVAALEEQVARLKAEVSKPRASTSYLQSRSPTPVNITPARAKLISDGVWNSMHNPYRPNGIAHQMLDEDWFGSVKRNRVDPRPTSPAASYVSNSPSLGEDGWWS